MNLVLIISNSSMSRHRERVEAKSFDLRLIRELLSQLSGSPEEFADQEWEAAWDQPLADGDRPNKSL